MRFRLIAAALLALLSANAFAYDASRAPRYASPDMYRPNVDSLTINGPGLTCAPGAACDVGGLKVALPSLATRTLLDRLLERPSIIDYGVDITGVNDSTAALTAALNSGKRVTAPCGTIRLVSTVAVTAQADFQGAGACTVLKYDAPAGAAVTPALDIQKTATGSRFDNFALDHQANTKGYAASTVYGGNIIASSAILVQADDTSITRTKVSNAFDNGIAVVQFAGTGYPVVAGAPKRWSLRNIRTFYNGVGSIPKAGGGIDIGSGSQGVVDDLVDVGSYGALGVDIGAGAQGTFSNLVGIGTKADPSLANDGTGSSNNETFYIGSSDSTFTNLTSIGSEGMGIWIDGPAKNTTVTNLYVKGPKKIGALLKSGQSTLANIVVNSPGFGSAAGTYDGVVIDSTASATKNLVINGLFVNSEFNTARYGINQIGSGPVTGAVLNANLSGAVAATNNLAGTFGVVDGAALGGAWTSYTPTVTCGTNGQSLGTVSASAQYRRVGKTVSVNVSGVTISGAGSCTGPVNVSVPFPITQRSSFSGQESSLTGKGLVGTVSEGTSVILIKMSDGSSPAVSNYVLTGRAEYQTP